MEDPSATTKSMGTFLAGKVEPGRRDSTRGESVMEAAERPRVLRNVRRFGSWVIISSSTPFMKKYDNGWVKSSSGGKLGG
jgi:hypothetical protein